MEFNRITIDGEKVTQILFMQEDIYLFAAKMYFRDTRKGSERATTKDIYLGLLTIGLDEVEKTLSKNRRVPGEMIATLCDIDQHNKGMQTNLALPKELQDRVIRVMNQFNEKIEADGKAPFMLDFMLGVMNYAIKTINIL